MTTKANAYAVLQLCLDDPDFSNEHVNTDIVGHIAQHMGRPVLIDGLLRLKELCAHIGFEELEYDLWQLGLHDQLPKDVVLRHFARMILRTHGPEEGKGVPSNLRLL